MICLNCNNEHNEKFCPNCGEKSEVSKITFSSIFKSAFSTITNMDKGFLFNVKNLFVSPQKIVIGYISGKRKNVFNPVSFLIVAVTIYLIAESLIDTSSEVSEPETKIQSFGYKAGKLIRHNFKYFWILSVIWLSSSTKLIFGKYNYAEHLAINSFVIGQTTLVALIMFVITKFSLLFNPLIYVFIFWMTYEIYKPKSKDFDTFFSSLGSTFLFFVQLILIIVVIGVVGTSL